MSSSILYKFRSGTTFEALPLPGSAARLLDIKKAIVTAKKLDQGSMDFELSVKDANTGAEYLDEGAILPRGTRLIVHRLPAQRGQGILAKIARSQYGGGYAHSSGGAAAAASHTTPSDFYTIDSHANDDEEFVASSSTAAANKEEQELAALRAVTETAAAATSVPASSRAGMMRGGRMQGPAGSGPPPPRANNFHHHHQAPRHTRQADPELQAQEVQPKKRATGIPRTFLNLSAPPTTDGGEGVSVPQIQPNTIGFAELVQRGGGQSENTAGTKRDLDYAIKLTATTIPEYLQCAICNGVVRDAMMLPWDQEGRTTCERCIRDALAQNGFRCPLTQQEGVSPDDLLPNHALRKAADQFVKEVMQKIQEIDEQAKVEETIVPEGESSSKVLEGDSADTGVVLTRRASAADQKRRKEEEDPFGGGGDDDFGGDVFEVEADESETEENEAAADTKAADTAAVEPKPEIKKEESALSDSKSTEANESTADVKVKEETTESSAPASPPPVLSTTSGPDNNGNNPKPQPVSSASRNPSDRRDNNQTRSRRGPPAGYTMGPAGGAVDELDNSSERPQVHSPRDNHVDQRREASYDDRSYRGGGGGYHAGGRGGYSGPPRYNSTPRGGGGRGSSYYPDSAPRDDVSSSWNMLMFARSSCSPRCVLATVAC